MGTVDAQFLGSRIQEERKHAGMSQDDLAAMVGLDRTAMTKIERGTRRVSALELSEIARAIGVRMTEFFVRPTAALVSHRSSQGLDVTDSKIDRILSRLAREVEFVMKQSPEGFGFPELESLLPQEFTAPISNGDAEEMAMAARQLIGVPEGDPIGKIVPLVASVGLLGFSQNIGNDTADAGTILLERGGVSLINSHMKVGRRRLALAHELGHYLLADEYTVDWRIASAESNRASLESKLDRFARALLLPEAALRHRWVGVDEEGQRDSAIRIASEFQVDMATLAKRLAELGLADGARTSDVRGYRTTQSDIVEFGLIVPPAELEETTVPQMFAKAVLRLVREERVSQDRAYDLLRGTIDMNDLPEPRIRRPEEIWNFVS